jgi:hypothetical protein
MRLLIALFIGMVLLFGSACNDLGEFVLENNEAPTVAVEDLEGLSVTETISIKLSNKVGTAEASIVLIVQDDENSISKITYEFILGEGNFYLPGETVPLNGTIPIPGDGRVPLRFEAASSGDVQVRIQAFDILGQPAGTDLEFFIFENLVPTADFTLEKVGVNSPLEYDLDASLSFDQDAAQGGFIEVYEWSIDGAVIQTSNEKIRHVFGQAKGYEIKLRVQDNDGEWSQFRTRIVEIN